MNAIGEIYFDGKTLWINSDVKCLVRVSGLDKVSPDMNGVKCVLLINRDEELIDVVAVGDK